MTARQIYDWVGSLPSAGSLSVDSRLDFGFVMQTFGASRSLVVMDRWLKDGSIPREYYQTITPTYNKLSQGDVCYNTFYGIPDLIALDGMGTGMGYVGTVNGIPCTFREVGTRAEFASQQHDRIMKAGRVAYILLNGSGECEIYYKDSIRDFRMDAILSNPMSLSTFNIEADKYPVAEDDLTKIANYMMSGGLSMPYKTPLDRINDGRDGVVQPLPRI